MGGAVRAPPAPCAPVGPGGAQHFWGQGGLEGREGAGTPTRGGGVSKGEHLRLLEWSPNDVGDYEERLRYFEGDHVFVGGEGVEGAEEEEGEEAEEEEGVEAEEEEGMEAEGGEVEETKEEEGGEEKEEERKAPVDIEPEWSIEVDVDAPP